MSRPTDVLCAGVVVADHLCAPIERLPKEGEIIEAERMVLTLGGGAANTAGASSSACSSTGATRRRASAAMNDSASITSPQLAPRTSR